MWLKRLITPRVQAAIARGKSILMLGPRQTGKTSLVKTLAHDLYITLMNPHTLQKYEANLTSFILEIKAQQKLLNRKLIVIVDEIQKIPDFTDSIQVLIDEGIAQFIITGSSARKIKNLLPGRVIKYNLAPLSLQELNGESLNLESLLVNGSLPEIYNTKSQDDINELLDSYVNLYIEEEIRKEALVRNIGSFTNFLRLACIESGNIVNFRKISVEIGVVHQTIAEYYRILEACMLVIRIEPLTISQTRKRLTKAPKFLLFDLGVKRIGAQEPANPGVRQFAFLFEQFIGLELYKMLQQMIPGGRLLFWRSHDGPEIDYVIELQGKYIPIEVKWSDKPNHADIKHIQVFRSEYPVYTQSYVICRCDAPMLLADNVMALPWWQLHNVFAGLAN